MWCTVFGVVGTVRQGRLGTLGIGLWTNEAGSWPCRRYKGVTGRGGGEESGPEAGPDEGGRGRTIPCPDLSMVCPML